MRRRPFWFILLACAFVIIAVGMPAQVMIIYGHGFDELSAVFEKLTALNWSVMAAALLCASMTWRASPHTKFLIPGFIVLVALNNFVVGYYATDFSMFTTAASTVGFTLLAVPLLHPDMQWLLLNPDKRWWMRADRKRLHLPVTVEGTRLQSSKAETFDISTSGAFIPVSQNVGVGDWVTLRMKFGYTQIRCQARVVRRSEPRGEYPAGAGVQFMNMSWRERRELQRCIDRQPSL
jgi:hypothetical protein